MFDSLPAKCRNDIERIQASTDAKLLLAELKELLEINIPNLIRQAWLIRRLEELEIEVTIQVPALKYVRKVAYGQLAPELFVSLGGCGALLERASRLPMPEQKKIAANQPIKVMELGGDFRMVPPLSMSTQDIQQVFGRDEIRDDAAQVAWLKGRQTRRAIETHDTPEVQLDRKRGGIVVGGHFVAATEMANYLVQLGTRR